MENFNFKVGDKVRLHYWNKERFITITAIGNNLFLGIDSMYKEENQYYYCDDWQLYQPTPEKVKLTKFYYCNCDYDLFYQQFAPRKEDLINMGARFVYTEKEFLEKFDVEI